MAQTDRPLSPHLQVYKPQITSAMSILHRVTGVALSVGTLALVWWVAAAATGADSYGAMQAVLGSFIGKLLLFGWSLALFYHMCNGVRHLFWDMGRGFALETVTKSGFAVLAAAGALTLATWIAAYGFA